MKNQMEKDVEATIRLLRFLTYHQGTSYLSVFDSGYFEEGSVTCYLERDGLVIEDRKFHSPKEFKDFIVKMANPFHLSDAEFNDYYKKRKWDSE